MKKISLALIGLLIVAAIYYFTTGSSQLTEKMQTEVSKQLTTLKSQGFTIEERTKTDTSEHFVISVTEPTKIASYLNTKGVAVHKDDLELIKGLKLGVDITYLTDAYSAASFDFYPVTLPTFITQATLNPEEKQLVTELSKLLKKKTFLLHADINKLANGFKGYIKDIHEVVEGSEKLKIDISDYHFNGDIKENKLSSITQTIKDFSIFMNDNFHVTLKNLNTIYTRTGTHAYDYNTDYKIESINAAFSSDYKLLTTNFSAKTASTVSNNLIAIDLQSNVDKIIITDKQNETILDTTVYTMKANNFDLIALEKLEKLGTNITDDSIKEIKSTFKQLVSKGVHFEIKEFSTKSITHDKQKIDGFKLMTNVDVDKSIDLDIFNKNPLGALNAFNADIDLTISNGLFGYAAKLPQAMMIMMFIQPKDVNGNKVYKIRLKDGTLKINDKAMM